MKKTFSVNASYVPDEIEGSIDSYKVSFSWSRRFTGLKIFMLLAELGNDNLSKLLTHQVNMGQFFKKQLLDNGWEIVGNSPLPVVCFTHPDYKGDTEKILQQVLNHKKVWLSKVDNNGESVFRVCISSFKTQTSHLEVLMKELNAALSAIKHQS